MGILGIYGILDGDFWISEIWDGSSGLEFGEFLNCWMGISEFPNVWMGVSVENEEYTFRIDDLRRSNAKIKFLSVEPLLGAINYLNLQGIDWVIVGGESGIGARPMETEWVRKVRDQCASGKVPFFFKQWGGVNKKKTGRTLDGVIWDEMPI